jgi:hypothetical protein
MWALGKTKIGRKLAQRARKLLPFHEREKNDTNKMKLWQEIRKIQHITAERTIV